MAELLKLYQQISISSRSIGRTLNQGGIGNIHAHKAPCRRRSRDRMPREGMLAQIDASPYAWLEERGPVLNLHGTIDDDTSKILGLHFKLSECLQGYMQVLLQMANNNTVSQQFYSDRPSIFFSPNKGKLTIDMRIANICSSEKANAFLLGFIKQFNNRFAVKPAAPIADYLLTLKTVECIICTKYKRKASKDSSISYQGTTYQLLNTNGSTALLRPRSTVEVLSHLDGSVSAVYEDDWFSLQACPNITPSTANTSCEKPKPVTKPALNHP